MKKIEGKIQPQAKFKTDHIPRKIHSIRSNALKIEGELRGVRTRALIP